jgi:hypothetical protein
MHGRPQPAPERLSRVLAARLAAMAACRQLPTDRACQGGHKASCISWHVRGRGSGAAEGTRWHAKRLLGMGWPQGAETVGQLGAGRVRTGVGELIC